ncbi:ROK family protein [Mariniplasma anaerobium]|uniref:Glucokinase n=1 Tax=Mariniplasma anaerobium TaxID=2735436 RepID=A0A7U9TJ70_9MOLU|nr:ROK family protein [Mariniplasma anaerobium]BCR35326.1 glucokinase [Mariniplasma anaerobium]
MSKYVYGIDVGGTSIKIGLFNFESMDMINDFEVETPKLNHKDSIFETIYQGIISNNEINNILMDDILGVGIDVPCPVKKGYVHTCANLNLNDTDLISSMKKYLPDHVELVAANDATIAAFGENASLKNPYDNAVLITLGTGVGGGVILDGAIVEGATGLGGEVGHIRVYDEEEKVCGCGSKGCLEQICGTAGILNYTKNLLPNDTSILDKDQLTVKAIFDAAKKGDPVALKTVHRVAKYIGIAASILSIINEPDVFIIGGGVSKSGKFLIDLIQMYYKENARFTTGDIPFKLAMTGNQAGIIGSAMLVKSVIVST